MESIQKMQRFNLENQFRLIETHLIELIARALLLAPPQLLRGGGVITDVYEISFHVTNI